MLQSLYEGDASVKQSKLQQIHTRFDELRMCKDETIVQFNTRVQELKLLQQKETGRLS